MNKLLCSVSEEEDIVLRDDLLSGAKEAADYIGKTPRTVYNLTEQGLLPCTKLGGKLYYRKSELEAAFRSGAK